MLRNALFGIVMELKRGDQDFVLLYDTLTVRPYSVHFCDQDTLVVCNYIASNDHIAVLLQNTWQYILDLFATHYIARAVVCLFPEGMYLLPFIVGATCASSALPSLTLSA